MKYNVLISILLLFQYGYSQTVKYHNVKVDMSSHTLHQLLAEGIHFDHGHQQEGHHEITVLNDIELEILDSLKVNYSIIQKDLSTHYQTRSKLDFINRNSEGICSNLLHKHGYTMPSGYAYGSMQGFHHYQEILDELDKLSDLYPDYFTKRKAIGDFKTHQDRPVEYVVMTNKNNGYSKPKMLMTGLHHAREPMSAEQMIFFMHFMMENRDKADIAYILDNTAMYLVPCVNPDGYEFNYRSNPNGGGLHRKNMNPEGTRLPGVDLNRNYGYKWGLDNIGSRPEADSESYRGEAPFSEPETQAIRKLCFDNNFLIAVNYHAHGDVLIYPYGYRAGEATPDDKLYETLSNEITFESRLFPGKAMETIGYVSNGDSDDWMYGGDIDKRKILAFTPELGSGFDGFWPLKSRIIPLCEEATMMNLKFAKLLINEIRQSHISDKSVFQRNFKHQIRFNNIGLQESASIVTFRDLIGNLKKIPSAGFVEVGNNQNAVYAFDFEFNSDVQYGDRAFIELTYNNNFDVKDTIEKVFLPSEEKKDLFNSHFTKVNRGVSSNSWGFTTSNCFSAPDCFTDSQIGNYSGNMTSEFVLDGPIPLPSHYEFLELTYKVKWDILRGYNRMDYAQVMISTDGVDFSPLCTENTSVSNVIEHLGEPVYTGKQSEWLLEQIDLKPYAGQNIWLKFVLKSNSGETADGIYIDDLFIDMRQTVDVSEPIAYHQFARVYPNPVGDELILDLNNQMDHKISSISILNMRGQEVEYLTNIQQNGQTKLNFANRPMGMYFVKFQLEDGRYSVAKVVH